MRILLTGACGFLGSYLVPRLRASGHEMTALARPSRKDGLEGQGCSVVQFDLAQKSSVPALGAHEVAIYLAQSPNYQRWPEGAADVVDVNLSGLVRFAEAARQANVRRFFFASSGTIYRPTFGPLREDSPTQAGDIYSWSKRAGEEAMRLYGQVFDIVALRPFAIYGPGQKGRMIPNIVGRIQEEKPVSLRPRRLSEENPDGLVITPCFVEDAVSILEKLLETPFNGPLNLAGPEAVSIRRIAEDAAVLLKKEPVFRVEAEPRTGDIVADISELRNLLQPTFTPFSEGLRRVVESDFLRP